MVRFGQQRYATAFDRYRRLVEIVPDGAQAHANLGATLYYLGRVDEAIRSLEHALSLTPALKTPAPPSSRYARRYRSRHRSSVARTGS